MNYFSDDSTNRLLPRGSGENGELEQAGGAFRGLDYRNSEFTWEQIVRVLRKNRNFGLGISIVLIGVTVASVMLMKNVYQPVARIEIAPPASGIRTLHEVESTAEVEDEDYLETQAQMLQSDALAVSVIRELHLDANSEFVGRRKTNRAGEKTAEVPPGPSALDKSPLADQMALATLTPTESIALDKFRKNLTVNTVRTTRLVEVSFSSHDPEISRQVTNEVIAKFIENDFKRRYNATTQASDWLSSQLNDLYQKVIASAQALSDYQKKYGLVDMDDHDLPSSQLMSEINRQLSDAQAGRIENEAYLQMIDAGQAQYVPAVRDDKVYQNLLIRQGDLRTQLAQARAVYGEANTNVRKIEDQIQEISTQVDDEQKRLGDGIRTAYSAAKERENLMLQARDKLQAKMVNLNSELVGYHLLKTQAIANADLYNTLQARLKEAGIYAGLGSNNIRVVDFAENLREPTGPHRTALIAIGAVASALFGVLACFFKESMNNTLRTPEDVRSWVGLRSLALLPAMNTIATGPRGANGASKKPQPLGIVSAGAFVSVMKPMTAESEAMRDLRTVLLASKSGSKASVILISSSLEGEGKTTVAVNFGIALAQIGRTCLVDADLRRPAMSGTFDVAPKPGLSEVLTGKAPLDAAVSPVPGIPDLWILPSGSVVESPADVLATSTMSDVCDHLRKDYQFIVIDSPPIIRFSDARYLSRLADEVVLIGRYGITTKRTIQRSAELLQDVQAPIAGVVLNGIDYSSPDYHYFTYGYSKIAGKQSGSGSAIYAGGTKTGAAEKIEKSNGAHA